MLNKFVLFISFSLLLSSCATFDKGGLVNLVIWGDFYEPQKNYESIIHDFYASGLIDSVKVIGRPFSQQIIEFEIDSAKAKHLDISIKEIQNVIDSMGVIEKLDEFRNSQIQSSDKKRTVPIEVITSIILKSEPFKPELYLQEPKVFRYKDESAVKIELYCKPQSKAKLEELIFKTMEKYSPGLIVPWNFEIIRGELPGHQ